MGIRTGAQYIDSLRDDRALYIAGRRVGDVTQYAPLAGILASIAEHYDAFHRPQLRADYTYPSPTDGKPVSNSFLPARTWDEVQQRLRGESARKEATFGLMGRLPDFMNAFVTDAGSWYARAGGTLPHPASDEKRFAELVQRAFAQRRKTLRNRLSGVVTQALFAAAGIDPGLRPEVLSVADFVRLAEA